MCTPGEENAEASEKTLACPYRDRLRECPVGGPSLTGKDESYETTAEDYGVEAARYPRGEKHYHLEVDS